MMLVRHARDETLDERKQYLLSIGITEKSINRLPHIRRQYLVPIKSTEAVISVLSNIVPDPIKFVNEHVWVLKCGSKSLNKRVSTTKQMLKEYGVECDIKEVFEHNIKLFTISSRKINDLGRIAFEYGGSAGFLERFNLIVSPNGNIVSRAYAARTEHEGFEDFYKRIRSDANEYVRKRTYALNSLKMSKSALNLSDKLRKEREAIEFTARTTMDPVTIKRIAEYGNKELVQIIMDRGLLPRTDSDQNGG